MNCLTSLNVSRLLIPVLYDYTNKERDLIQRCFRTGNYNALRELPNHIAPNQVLRYARDK